MNRFSEIFFTPRRMMKNYCKRPDIESRSKEELEIMISTIELEIQRTTSNKGIFLSTIAIVMAILLLILGDYNAATKAVTVVGMVFYVSLFIVYYFFTNREINKLYDYLNELRYVFQNKQ